MSKEEEKIIKGQFYNPKKVGKYKFIKFKISPSSILQAGLGCYTLDFIPKGSRGKYRGIYKSKDSQTVEPTYSWSIFKYNKKGKTTYNTLIGYIDGSNDKYANWSRYVNCGEKDVDNNMEADQNYDKLYYIALRDIYPGEELFIDYGIEYRRDNLKMKGKY